MTELDHDTAEDLGLDATGRFAAHARMMTDAVLTPEDRARLIDSTGRVYVVILGTTHEDGFTSYALLSGEHALLGGAVEAANDHYVDEVDDDEVVGGLTFSSEGAVAVGVGTGRTASGHARYTFSIVPVAAARVAR